MRWRDLEDGAWWVIPAEVAKNGMASRVPLSSQVREILDQLRPLTGSGEYVLASPYKTGAPLTTVKTAADTVVRNHGMRPWTPHDLRRTAASKMSAQGVSHRVLQAILNHKDRSVTAVYDRYAMDQEKTEALAAWGCRVEEIVDGGTPAEVVPFPSRPLRAIAGEGRAVWRRGQGSQ